MYIYIYIPTRWCIIVCEGWTRFMLMVEQSRVIGVYKSTYNWGLCRLHTPILFGSWCQFLQTEDLGKYVNLFGILISEVQLWCTLQLENSGQIDSDRLWTKETLSWYLTNWWICCRLRQNCRKVSPSAGLTTLGSPGSAPQLRHQDQVQGLPGKATGVPPVWGRIPESVGHGMGWPWVTCGYPMFDVFFTEENMFEWGLICPRLLEVDVDDGKWLSEDHPC